MKKSAALLLALTLLLTLFGCAQQPMEMDAVDEFVELERGEPTEFVAFGKEEADISEEPLRILMDLEYVGGTPYNTSSVLNEFLNTLEQSGGISDVVIEYVPKHGEDRENMLETVRMELEAGGGPDVFILGCGGMPLMYSPDVKPLFPFPERAMEDGVFLPLDTYMETATRFTEWDKQTQAVLAAGRNEEGQQIIPLTYDVPVLCYSAEDVPEFTVEEGTTWVDIVNDPALADIVRPMYDASSIVLEETTNSFVQMVSYTHAEFIFGALADYAERDLLFTEDEIFERFTEIRALSDMSMQVAPYGVEQFPYAVAGFGRDLGIVNGAALIKQGIETETDRLEFFGSEPLTLIPLYSDDGGVTASVMSFAAVNRNTRCPDKAYTVIDLLMRDHVQRKYNLYSELLSCGGTGISMHEGLMLEETSVGGNSPWHTSEQRYGEICKVRDQITTVKFRTALDVELEQMMMDCLYSYFNGSTDEEVKATITAHYERMQNMLYE